MKTDPWKKDIANSRKRRRKWKSKGQTAEPCNYCGLSRAHLRGKNCPAYGLQCKRFDHFSSVCRADMSPTDSQKELTTKQEHRKARAKKSDTYSSSDISDDDFSTVCWSFESSQLMKSLPYR